MHPEQSKNTHLKLLNLGSEKGILLLVVTILHNLHTDTFFKFLYCAWNLFLKHDVQLQSEHLGNQLPVIAKGEHTLKLYDLDKPKPFRQLYKLTDTHLNPTAQSAMNVSLAA
jgi:hypothetical protein